MSDNPLSYPSKDQQLVCVLTHRLANTTYCLLNEKTWELDKFTYALYNKSLNTVNYSRLFCFV